jgi:hypothetical protein
MKWSGFQGAGTPFSAAGAWSMGFRGERSLPDHGVVRGSSKATREWCLPLVEAPLTGDATANRCADTAQIFTPQTRAPEGATACSWGDENQHRGGQWQVRGGSNGGVRFEFADRKVKMKRPPLQDRCGITTHILRFALATVFVLCLLLTMRLVVPRHHVLRLVFLQSHSGKLPP